MDKCKLCNKNNANQTGSHLTSCFIVTSQIGKRGSEKSYISTPESNENFSKNVGSDEITEDYILCSACEKRLSFLETYFSQEYTYKIGLETQRANFPIKSINDTLNTKYISCENINKIAFHLFIYSIIWRASISNKQLFLRFKLPSHAEENIRGILDLFLPDYQNFTINIKLKIWLKEILSVSDLFYLYPYVILKKEEELIKINELSENATREKNAWKEKNITYFSDVEKSPYHIFLNEFIILGFFNNEEIDFRKEDWFKLSEKYNLRLFINQKSEPTKIGVLKNEDWEEILYQIYKAQGEIIFRNILNECKEHFISQGKEPSETDLKRCVQNRINK